MISYIRKVKYSPAPTPTTTPVYVTLRVPPPLDSEMGWTYLIKALCFPKVPQKPWPKAKARARKGLFRRPHTF